MQTYVIHERLDFGRSRCHREYLCGRARTPGVTSESSPVIRVCLRSLFCYRGCAVGKEKPDLTEVVISTIVVNVNDG